MAEALLTHYMPDVQVKSAGLYATDGQEANEKSIAALLEKGIHLDHAASFLTNEVMDWADIVLTMTMGHKSMLLIDYPDNREKIATLIEYTTEKTSSDVGNLDIVDPYGAEFATYQATCAELELHIKQLISKL